jgi:hypothetical protein
LGRLVFSEFFQEKKGTSLGNAISNSVITLWASIDCIRQTVYLMQKKLLVGFGSIVIRFSLVAAIFLYSAAIIYLGLKGHHWTKKIGRIRTITYIFIMLVPVFYGAAPLTFSHILGSILFFPIFYYAIELIDMYTPNPKSVLEERN